MWVWDKINEWFNGPVYEETGYLFGFIPLHVNSPWYDMVDWIETPRFYQEYTQFNKYTTSNPTIVEAHNEATKLGINYNPNPDATEWSPAYPLNVKDTYDPARSIYRGFELYLQDVTLQRRQIRERSDQYPVNTLPSQRCEPILGGTPQSEISLTDMTRPVADPHQVATTVTTVLASSPSPSSSLPLESHLNTSSSVTFAPSPTFDTSPSHDNSNDEHSTGSDSDPLLRDPYAHTQAHYNFQFLHTYRNWLPQFYLPSYLTSKPFETQPDLLPRLLFEFLAAFSICLNIHLGFLTPAGLYLGGFITFAYIYAGMHITASHCNTAITFVIAGLFGWRRVYGLYILMHLLGTVCAMLYGVASVPGPVPDGVLPDNVLYIVSGLGNTTVTLSSALRYNWAMHTFMDSLPSVVITFFISGIYYSFDWSVSFPLFMCTAAWSCVINYAFRPNFNMAFCPWSGVANCIYTYIWKNPNHSSITPSQLTPLLLSLIVGPIAGGYITGIIARWSGWLERRRHARYGYFMTNYLMSMVPQPVRDEWKRLNEDQRTKATTAAAATTISPSANLATLSKDIPDDDNNNTSNTTTGGGGIGDSNTNDTHVHINGNPHLDYKNDDVPRSGDSAIYITVGSSTQVTPVGSPRSTLEDRNAIIRANMDLANDPTVFAVGGRGIEMSDASVHVRHSHSSRSLRHNSRSRSGDYHADKRSSRSRSGGSTYVDNKRSRSNSRGRSNTPSKPRTHDNAHQHHTKH